MTVKDTLFWFCALAGTGMFLIQFTLSFIGLDAEDGEEGSSQNFKWLSKQAITGFLMMFGLIGLGCRNELEFSPLSSMIIATLAGLVTMSITGMIFKLSRKLRSSGTVFRIEDAIGKEASVYQRIPPNGVGKVTVSLQDISHELDAISLNGEEIGSFCQVKIVKKADAQTLVVTPAKQETYGT